MYRNKTVRTKVLTAALILVAASISLLTAPAQATSTPASSVAGPYIMIAMAKKPKPLINPRKVKLDIPGDEMEAGQEPYTNYRYNGYKEPDEVRSVPLRPYDTESKEDLYIEERSGPRGPELKEIYDDIDNFNRMERAVEASPDAKKKKRKHKAPKEDDGAIKGTLKKVDPRKLKFW